MVDILVKDKLRASIEASSGGKQTVMYTAKGQPSYMNVVEAFENSLFGSVDGLGATHPAFIYQNVRFSIIYVGTYIGTMVNGELLSLPYSSVSGSKQSLYDSLKSARACGRGFHMMSNKEYTAVAYQGMVNGGLNLGNSNNGMDYKGNKGTIDPNDSTMTLTGSGGYKWSHDGTISGIQDLCANGWQFSGGVRIRGGELQIQSSDKSYNYETADEYLKTEWFAMDASTGNLIPSTEEGTIGNANFKVTTSNSIRFASTSDSLPVNAIYFGNWQRAIPSNYLLGSGISASAIAQLKVLGILPLSNGTTMNTAYFGFDPLSTNYFIRGGNGFGQSSGMFSLASAITVDGSDGNQVSNSLARPCFIGI